MPNRLPVEVIVEGQSFTIVGESGFSYDIPTISPAEPARKYLTVGELLVYHRALVDTVTHTRDCERSLAPRFLMFLKSSGGGVEGPRLLKT